MQLFITDQRKVWKVGQVAALSHAELSALFARRLVPTGMPILLDEAMRPVEPVTSWFRSLALERKDAPKSPHRPPDRDVEIALTKAGEA
ncbi:hypothetical protein ACIQKB_36880 [Streptomyces sp. NPDC092046]|uniref:hypothetical protein n=1 Tax=Streptomyces sp. NPDC092046 TaxID=3366009 RepID=UPI003813A9C6